MAGPDRRLAPRPLPAHLLSAIFLWLSSRAALTSSKLGSTLSNAAENPLQQLAPELEKLGADRVAAALDGELLRRAEGFAAGLEAYRRHPYRRAAPRVPVIWQEGEARLLDCSRDGEGPAVLVVPSLINRYYVLDLLPERSFLRHLAEAGLRPFVVDWGEPGRAEQAFGLTDYIAGPLDRAMTKVRELGGGPVAIIGYCMGGLLALALALRRPADTAALALLATPWDFHAGQPAQAQWLGELAAWLPRFLAPSEPLPLSIIQFLFLMLDPFLAERKFIRFGTLDPDGAAARGFVALEDWINDGVPLAHNVAVECLRSWYGDNAPACGKWRVAGQPVRPEDLRAPALVVLPRRDRIVPPRAAAPLAEAIPQAEVLRPPFGHIGMMASADAPPTVWQPIANWLRANLL
ncbi:MAG: alpha/beta fold hydrolase [Alphaproteobacteria bacterium]|nr:alpha/beta fold hydrolase [Alphaproteobacteria bacterium]